MMLAVLGLGLLFLAGAAYNTFGPEPDRAEALAGAVIAAVLFGLFAVLRRHARRSDELADWLLQHADDLERRGVAWDGRLVTATTELVRYEVALSFLIVSVKLSTRPYIDGHDPTMLRAIGATVASLLLGWWGIPWGPIYTVQAVFRNLRGGQRETVAEHLGRLRVAPQET